LKKKTGGGREGYMIGKSKAEEKGVFELRRGGGNCGGGREERGREYETEEMTPR